MTYPTEYRLRDGDQFILSNKVLPQNMQAPHVRQGSDYNLARAVDKSDDSLMLPQRATTSTMIQQFAACPRDRVTRWCVWHEPENDMEHGVFTQQQYDDAWARARVAQQQVGPHIVLCVILMGYTFLRSSHRNPEDFIPPDANWDELLVDTYFGGSPGSIGQPVSEIPHGFDGSVAVAKAHGKKFGVAETGVGRRVSGAERKAAVKLLAQTVWSLESTVGCYFTIGDPAQAEWGLSLEEAAAWKEGQVA
jgi:hypothetical protein